MFKIYTRLFLLIVFIWSFQLSAFAQELINCSTPEVHEAMRKEYPGLSNPYEFNKWIESLQARQSPSATRAVETLPVVVHLIHNGERIGTGANLSEERVISQIDVLNEDFRRASGTPGFNTDPAGADSEIEFCLAYVGPDGIPLDEAGIDRVDRDEAGFTAPPYAASYINNVIKPQTIWNPREYINIWVVDGILDENGNPGIGGFATLPTRVEDLEGLPSLVFTQTDGVVVLRSQFGRQGGSDGRTTTHEIGHYLGLLHLGGPGNLDDGNTCEEDDFCEDTPFKDQMNNGCNFGASSCGSVDQLANYMIAQVGPCRNLFTNCQVSRMRTVIENAPQRVELLSSTVCNRPTEPPIADFELESDFSCTGEFRILDRSENLPSNWFWIFSNGAVDSVKNPVFQVDSPTTITVTLIANSPIGPSQPVTKTFDLSLGEPGFVDAGEDIEACVGDQVQIDGTISGSGTISWTPTTGLSDPSIINPTLTAQNTTTYFLSITGNDGCRVDDTINVSVVPRPTTIAIANESVIDSGETVQLNAIGASNYEWSPSETLSDPNIANPVASPAQTTTYVVRGFNNEGCEKLDSVTITVNVVTSLKDPFNTIADIALPYPNPSEGKVQLSGKFIQSGALTISLFSLSGKKMETIYHQSRPKGSFSYEWEYGQQLPAGVYFLNWEMNGLRHIQKIHIK